MSGYKNTGLTTFSRGFLQETSGALCLIYAYVVKALAYQTSLEYKYSGEFYTSETVTWTILKMASCNLLPLFYSKTLFGSRCRNNYWNVTQMLFITMVILLAVCPYQVQTLCTKINNCKCKMDNGQIIDLSSIGNNGGSIPK